MAKYTDIRKQGVVKAGALPANLSAGTGISITGTYPNQTITNTAPDQVVSLTGGTGVTISGAYPSFTINAATGITVGTTAVTSGTAGRVFFEGAGNVVQQDAGLFWDNTNKRLGVGATPDTAVRLDVRAQGALSTDIALRVRNSADTADIFSIRGNNDIYLPVAAANSSNFIYAGTDSLLRYTSSVNDSVALGRGATFTNGTFYNTVIGANASTGTLAGFGISIGYGSGANATGAINIGRTRANGSYTIRIGYDGGASQYGGTNSIHLGKTQSGNDITADDIFMTYFNSQSSSTLTRSNGSFGLLGQQAYILSNGGGTFGIETFMGNGGNTLVVRNHPSVPSTNITDSYQQYSADRGGVAGKAAAHFRAEDGTINVIGDLSGFGTSAPGARLDVHAQGALSTDIAFRVRNSANTGNIVTVQGNGDAIFNNITHGAIISNTNSVASGDTNLQLYTYGSLSTKVSSMISYFGSNGLNANKGVAIGWTPTTTLSAPLDVFDLMFSSTGKSVARFGNYVNLNDDNFNILFSTRYCGISSGNNLAKLQIGHIGSGTNNNARSFFKFELLRNNTLAERASITSQSNLLLQTPTEDTNDIGVIYIPNGTAPTGSITDGYKQYSADITAGNAAPHFRTEAGDVIKLYKETTGVAAAALVGGGGTTITDTDTFGGYTLQQVVKALQNLGILA